MDKQPLLLALMLGCAHLSNAQWDKLVPSVEYIGEAEVVSRITLMTGPDEGFHVLGLYFSPSSGYGSVFYRTDNDCSTVEGPLPGFGTGSVSGIGCCSAE